MTRSLECLCARTGMDVQVISGRDGGARKWRILLGGYWWTAVHPSLGDAVAEAAGWLANG